MVLSANCPASPAGVGLVSVLVVAKYLGVSRSKVYAMMEQGELSFVKLGKARRIPWDAVQRLVQENMVQ